MFKESLAKLHKPAPRYTSYPTAPEFSPIPTSLYQEHLRQAKEPLSLYFHIPFCKSMCLFCGCSVILNRKEEREQTYVEHLIQEIQLVRLALGRKALVRQLHFGGGTPTKLSIELLGKLFAAIDEAFTLDFSGEIAIEIDPRTVVEDGGEKMKFLRSLGFNRVSFGVQDTDPKVQEAVKRRQSKEMSETTFHLAKKMGFSGINVDLIYGLPYQTEESFRQTTKHILALRPDRIAFFSYAKVPWLKKHQKAIRDETLPSTTTKFAIYAESRKAFEEAGYLPIGMDHFALKEDTLAKAYEGKFLQRNFQGYTVHLAEDLIGMGVTAIGSVAGAYFQNLKELDEYQATIQKGILPSMRGKVLSSEDHLRRWVIHTLMCNFELEKAEFLKRFGTPFDDHFADVSRQELIDEELIKEDESKILVTPLGELFVRNVAMCFDAYLGRASTEKRFSQSV